MKKIILTLSFLLLGTALMASDRDRPNSISFFGVSTANNHTQWAKKDSTQTYFSAYENVPQFDAKVNPSITFLRRVSNNLSMGVDLAAYSSDGINTSEVSVNGAANTITTNRFKANYDSATVMLLLDYEFLSLGHFDFSAQVGGGFASSVLDLDYSDRTYDMNGNLRRSRDFSGSDVSSTYATKTGLIASYNFTSFFGISLGTFYTYSGKSKFHLADTSYRVKDKGITSTNLSLKWMF
ncbi:MAG: hypothetical protein LBQ34_04165 [Alphaproteobacteria bacterium]|jgi:hypothetical protein|nr:hypothetical protein [Alphaproteobacteria bacterium]